MASALSYDHFLAGVSNLPELLINHELRIRDFEPQGGPVHNKRRQLARVLFEEYASKIPPKIDDEKVSMDLCKIAQFIFAANREFSSRDSDTRTKASRTLMYIHDRLTQMNFTSEIENDNATALIGTIKSVITPDSMNESFDANVNANANASFSDTSVNASDKRSNDTVNLSEQLSDMNLDKHTETQPIVEKSFPLTNEESIFVNPIPPTNNHIGSHAQHGTYATSLDTIKKISKWNIKFTNDNKMSVFEFIDKVEAKANVYGVSENDLFRVASEFFEGFPSKWHKSTKFNDWSHLKEMLVRDFVGLDYSDNLLRKIHETKQKQNETVLQFFTDFEDNCSRLVNKLPDNEKIRILKLNVLQLYRPQIALVNFDSLDSIKKALQILENTMTSYKHEQNRYTRFGSNDRSNSSQNFNQNYRSNGEQRSRYDKYRSNNGNVTFNAQNNRSFSNSSRDNSAHKQYQSTNHRSPTPHNRFNSQERSHSRDRSQSRGNSNERYARTDNANKNPKN